MIGVVDSVVSSDEQSLMVLQSLFDRNGFLHAALPHRPRTSRGDFSHALSVAQVADRKHAVEEDVSRLGKSKRFGCSVNDASSGVVGRMGKNRLIYGAPFIIDDEVGLVDSIVNVAAVDFEGELF